jgi:peptide/nickel transport system permease protein
MTRPKPRLALGLNWPFTLGALIVLGVLFVAVFGPQLAPRDRLQGSLALKVGDEFMTAPFAPFAVPGFPLGSDERGRDLVSLLLWAVRPTLLLVALVTAARLLLGLLVGLASGWSTTWLGRGLDALISAALAAPVLIVSLAVIAALGVEPGQGVRTFVLGLALAGWAETARAVREQTRAQRGQPYVEAAPQPHHRARPAERCVPVRSARRVST